MKERHEYRQGKLPTYLGLIDFLEGKGHDVTELRRLYQEAQLTPEEAKMGMEAAGEMIGGAMNMMGGMMGGDDGGMGGMMGGMMGMMGGPAPGAPQKSPEEKMARM